MVNHLAISSGIWMTKPVVWSAGLEWNSFASDRKNVRRQECSRCVEMITIDRTKNDNHSTLNGSIWPMPPKPMPIDLFSTHNDRIDRSRRRSAAIMASIRWTIMGICTSFVVDWPTCKPMFRLCIRINGSISTLERSSSNSISTIPTCSSSHRLCFWSNFSLLDQCNNICSSIRSIYTVALTSLIPCSSFYTFVFSYRVIVDIQRDLYHSSARHLHLSSLRSMPISDQDQKELFSTLFVMDGMWIHHLFIRIDRSLLWSILANGSGRRAIPTNQWIFFYWLHCVDLL